MKKFSVIVFLMMASWGYSFAQDGTAQARGERKTMEERVEIRTNKMVGELALTPEQTAKLKEIHLKQAEKMKAMREKQAAENQTFRQEAKAIATETEKQYEAILTPEQLEKYKQSKAQKADGKGPGNRESRKRSKR
jgi:Spy/CpxP family protein refolding chaperone